MKGLSHFLGQEKVSALERVGKTGAMGTITEQYWKQRFLTYSTKNMQDSAENSKWPDVIFLTTPLTQVSFSNNIK